MRPVFEKPWPKMMNREARRQQKRLSRKARRAGRDRETMPVPVLEKRADTLYRSGRLGQALRTCQRILAVQPQRADVLSFAAMIASELGDYTQAAEMYGAALTHEPDYAEAHYNHGIALKQLDRPEEATAAYRRAVELRPDLAPAHNNLGNVLQSLGRFDEAAAAYRRALTLMPETIESHRNLGIVLEKSGRADEAVAAYRRCLEIRPDWPGVYPNLPTLLLQLGEARAVLAACDHWLGLSPGNTGALALKALALNELGQHDPAQLLLDFDRFVHVTRHEAPPGYATLADFNQALAGYVRAHPTLRTPSEGEPTYHHPGFQLTDELLPEKDGPMVALSRMMYAAAEDYLRSLAEDPAHPFLAQRPRQVRLSSRASLLDRQGNLLPHIHLSGYLSGVYYVELPDIVSAPGQGRAGGFELGRPPAELRCAAEPRVRSIQPEEGMMLLFPSYFYHGTVPFESQQQRISIAFDVLAES